MSSLVSMPDPSMAESPLDFGEGVNECAMFTSALDSAAALARSMRAQPGGGATTPEHIDKDGSGGGGELVAST